MPTLKVIHIAKSLQANRTSQNLSISMPLPTLTEENSQWVTANHGTQPVSGHLEKLLKKETYVALKTFGSKKKPAAMPYLRNVSVHF